MAFGKTQLMAAVMLVGLMTITLYVNAKMDPGTKCRSDCVGRCDDGRSREASLKCYEDCTKGCPPLVSSANGCSLETQNSGECVKL